MKQDAALAVACLVVSVAPDLDFAVGPFAGRSYHHYFSHSLGFAAGFGLAAYGLARAFDRSKPLWTAGVLLGVYLSHIFLDLLAKDTSSPFGVQLLWPLSEAFYISPVILFDDVWRGSLGRLLGVHNWITVAREVLFLLPICALLWWRRRT